MISLYTLQRFVHFPPQDSTSSMIGRSRHSLSEALSLYSGQTVTPTFPYIFQPITERGHTTYSTMPEPIMACGCKRKFLGMKYHMIPLSLGGEPRKNHTSTLGFPKWTNTGFSRCPNQSTQMCIKVAILLLSSIINSRNFHVHHDPIPVYEHG